LTRKQVQAFEAAGGTIIRRDGARKFVFGGEGVGIKGAERIARDYRRTGPIAIAPGTPPLSPVTPGPVAFPPPPRLPPPGTATSRPGPWPPPSVPSVADRPSGATGTWQTGATGSWNNSNAILAGILGAYYIDAAGNRIKRKRTKPLEQLMREADARADAKKFWSKKTRDRFYVYAKRGAKIGKVARGAAARSGPAAAFIVLADAYFNRQKILQDIRDSMLPKLERMTVTAKRVKVPKIPKGPPGGGPRPAQPGAPGVGGPKGKKIKPQAVRLERITVTARRLPVPSIPATPSRASRILASPYARLAAGAGLSFLTKQLGKKKRKRRPGSPVAPDPITPTSPVFGISPQPYGGGLTGFYGPGVKSATCECPPKRKRSGKKPCKNPVVRRTKRKEGRKRFSTVTRELKCPA
jgi:hypothetical protein